MIIAHPRIKGVVLTLGLAACLPLALASLPREHLAFGTPLPAGIQQAATAPTVRIAPSPFRYRSAGSFLRADQPVNAPLQQREQKTPLIIMQAQVSETAYEACVQAGACRPTTRRTPARADLPVTGVSFYDASAYAHWLSARTGETWRLPSDAEWVFAAGSRATDDAIEAEGDDFSKRWLAEYEREAARGRTTDRQPRPVGSFGANEHGLLDVSGNVWEWTQTCFSRQPLDAADQPIGAPTLNCGVRVLQGAHRTYASDFIRDARGGGCSVGTPPDNLGFRLVRERGSWLDRAIARTRNGLGLG